MFDIGNREWEDDEFSNGCIRCTISRDGNTEAASKKWPGVWAKEDVSPGHAGVCGGVKAVRVEGVRRVGGV